MVTALQRMAWKALILVLFLGISNASNVGVIRMGEPASSVVNVISGGEAMLSCSISGAHIPAPLWRRAEGGVLTAGSTTTTTDTRYSVIKSDGRQNPNEWRDGKDEVWVLVIKDVRMSDAGVYVCELNMSPIVRSFHTLKVLPAEVRTGNKSLSRIYLEEYNNNNNNNREMSDTISNMMMNYTECCTSNNVSDTCLSLCNFNIILEGNLNMDPENCEDDLYAIRRCMTDGRNHVPCCLEEGVPDMCLDLCKGQYTPTTDKLRTHISCAAFTEITLACIYGGIKLLPGPPQDVEVEPLTEKSIKFSWSPPLSNYATVTEYVLNITSLRSFDSALETVSDIPLLTPDYLELRSRQKKVSANKNSVVLSDLSPFTMYEITAIAVNNHGSSVPSNAIRSLTLTPGTLKPLKLAEPPHLPDTKQCCLNKGITNSICVDTFCDPRNTMKIKEKELLSCASLAPEAFSCLLNGHDHTPCCRSRGLPVVCQDLCKGNLTKIGHTHFICLDYMSDYVSCLLQGYGVLPGPPSRIHVAQADTDFAILSWSAPLTLGDTVQYYDLFYKKVADRDATYSIIKKIHPPYILENLESDEKYEIYVHSVNAHGIGEPSARVIFKTKSKLVEEAVRASRWYNSTGCCLSVGLSDVCIPLCSYEATVKDITTLADLCTQDFYKILKCAVGGRDHSKCCQRRGVPDTCSPLCMGLMHDTLQNITKNCQPYIGNIFQCLEEGTGILPNPVEELYATVIKNNSVKVSWAKSKENSQTLYYVIHSRKIEFVKSKNITMREEKRVNVTGTLVELQDLQPDVLYEIFVTAHNQYGASLPSNIILRNTTKIGDVNSSIDGITSAPHSLAVSGHSANWITVTWQPPYMSHPQDFITYKFYYKQVGEDKYKRKTTTVTSHTLDGLSPNTQYALYVEAAIPQGNSPPSETLLVWTDPAYPAFVETPTIHPVNMIMEGSSMTVLCIAMGTPMPTISLYISGRLIRQEVTRHMVTKIQNVTREMDQISCYADNGYGTPMQASKKITISHGPSIHASGTVLAVMGGSVMVECNVSATPQPQLAFWRDPLGRVPVIQGPKYNIQLIPDNEEKSRFTMRLSISEMSDVDEGDYFCHAENAFGSVVQPVSVRIHSSSPSHNVTQCCVEQNVSIACMDACSFYLDIDSVIDKPECVADFDKLMKCAAEGSDHRSCCTAFGVPRRCLDWCRGEPLLSARLCVLSHTREIAACFHAGRDRLPGPPRNLRVVSLGDRSVTIKWDKPMKNPHTVEIYHVYWRPVGTRSPDKGDTQERSLDIVSLKEGVTYECVVKAGNHFGTSALTEPVQFTVGSKYLTPTSVNGHLSRKGILLGILSICVAVAAFLMATIWVVRNRKIFGIKSVSGVAFENPSYLKEISSDYIQNTSTGSAIAETTNNHMKGLPSVSGGTVFKSEAVQQEVDPSLYEELKLGHDGAGFKRLKLVSKPSSSSSQDEDIRKDTY